MPDPDALLAALRHPPTGKAAALDALAGIDALRAAVDAYERAAIDAARAGGASWAEIAAALGLASRQAAEQRRIRLGGPRTADRGARHQRRQQSVDTLQHAVLRLVTRLEAAPEEHRRGAVGLALDTLLHALDSPKGQLIDLARLAITDLTTGPDPYAERSPEVRRAVDRLAELTR